MSASAEGSEGDASSAAAAAATATVLSEADEEELWAGLEDLDDGAEISDTMLGLQPVGKAVYQAALDGQVPPFPSPLPPRVCTGHLHLHCSQVLAVPQSCVVLSAHTANLGAHTRLVPPVHAIVCFSADC